MKYARFLFAILSMIILFCTLSINVCALNTGFAVENFSDEQLNKISNNFKITSLQSEPKRNAIDCFAVSESGMVAIGCSSSVDKTVCVYSDNGVFEYGYKFETYGTFGLDFDGDNVIIYLVRSGAAILVNKSAEIESIFKISDTKENTRYWNNHVYSNKHTALGKTYFLRNDMGVLNIVATSYSQLIVLDENGESSVIYDVNANQLTKTLIILVLVCGFVAVVIFVIIRSFRHIE